MRICRLTSPISLFWSFLIFCIVGSVGSPVAFAEKIKEIRVQGQRRIEADAIRGKILSVVGAEYESQKVADSLRAIHGLGFFDDIQADFDGGVLTFLVKERPTISSIEFDGNEQISDSDLKEVVRIKEYSILDVNKVKEDIGLLQKHYEDKGFYLARVQYEVQQTSVDDEVKLVYKIQDYDKVQIKKISFINNRRFADEQLRNVFRGSREGNFLSFISGSGSFKENLFKQDLQLLTLFYLNEGYLRFRYDQPIVTVSDDKKWLYVSIYVDEGESYKVGSIDFAGDLLFEKDELRESLGLLEGQTFSITKRNNDIQALTEKYQDLGYAFVNVNPKIQIHDETKTADLLYEFEKGPLVHIGEINIVGNTKTRDKVIRRELRVREGELYHGTRFRQSRERVERLGFFAPGEVVFNTVTPKGKTDVVDIEISVKERSTGTLTLGMGYGSVQGFFVTAQIAEINLFGRGHNLALSGQYSADQRQRLLNLGFTEPYFFDTEWSVGGDLFFMTYQIPNRYLLFKRGLAVRLGHPITDLITGLITYKLETMRAGQRANNSNIDDDGDRGSLSSVVLSVVRDARNNRFETSAGNYQSLSAEYAGLMGRKRFAKLGADFRYYHPIFDFAVFRAKFEVGQAVKTADLEVPPAERFFLGGPNSMKGYNLFTLSPKDKFGVAVGGTAQAFAIAELEFPLIREAGLKFATFFDIGNSVAHWHDFLQTHGIRESYGFGFRWFSPIGPLRFEWGIPVSPQPGEDGLVFNFFIGPPF